MKIRLKTFSTASYLLYDLTLEGDRFHIYRSGRPTVASSRPLLVVASRLDSI